MYIGGDGVPYLEWEDLTEKERQDATEQYLCIREVEEERDRDEVTDEYPEPMDASGVESCSFVRDKDGCILVYI